MKSFTEPLEAGKFYHIYNRGINGCNIFSSEKNYHIFLEKYASHSENVLTTYAYSFLQNHFHLFVKVKSELEIRTAFSHLKSKDINQIVSSQLAHLFNGYAQYFNLSTERTGKLFELPFRRKLVTSNSYFSQLIYYIHTNAQKHGLVKDFRDYKYSSFWSYVSEALTKLPREDVIKWYGSKDEYLKFHQQNVNFSIIKNFIIE